MKAILLAGALALAAGGTAGAQIAVPAEAARPVATYAEIDRIFDGWAERTPIPGMVYGIVRDGRLVHVRAIGVQDLDGRRPVGPDTLFRIASMSKAFTALAILKLRDEGLLELDAPAETYVPEMRGWTYPTTDSPRIRIRDLLHHSGGLVTDDPWGDRQQELSDEEFTRIIEAGVPFSRVPGTQREYSNFGYALLGRIVANVSGRPYKDYIEQEILRPLGMASTGYEVAESPAERRAIGYRWENDAWLEEPTMRHGAFGAMGGLQTSAEDYSRWVAYLLSAWPPRDGPETGPVRRATVREMIQGLNFPNLTQRSRGGEKEPCQMPINYGMGFAVAKDCDFGTLLMHGGGYPGYGSYVMLFPDSGTGLFGFTNRTYTTAAQPMMEAAAALHAAGLMPQRETPVTADITRAYAAAGAMYVTGSLAPAREMLAMNFLMDRTEENWSRELAELKAAAGACGTDAPITATGALSGTFVWPCERGRIEGQLLLSPTNPPGIQSLRLRPAPAD